MTEISGARCHSTIQPTQPQEHHSGGNYVAMTAIRRISINLERRKLAKAPVRDWLTFPTNSDNHKSPKSPMADVRKPNLIK